VARKEITQRLLISLARTAQQLGGFVVFARHRKVH
jgi:hypothetical protein